jgi:hypothetical protein
LTFADIVEKAIDGDSGRSPGGKHRSGPYPD